MEDQDFNTDTYKPGSSGESALYRDFLRHLNLA